MESKLITITEEEINDLRHCVERVSSHISNIPEIGIDLWPLTIMDIIMKWDNAKAE